MKMITSPDFRKKRLRPIYCERTQLELLFHKKPIKDYCFKRKKAHFSLILQ